MAGTKDDPRIILVSLTSEQLDAIARDGSHDSDHDVVADRRLIDDAIAEFITAARNTHRYPRVDWFASDIAARIVARLVEWHRHDRRENRG